MTFAKLLLVLLLFEVVWAQTQSSRGGSESATTEEGRKRRDVEPDIASSSTTIPSTAGEREREKREEVEVGDEDEEGNAKGHMDELSNEDPGANSTTLDPENGGQENSTVQALVVEKRAASTTPMEPEMEGQGSTPQQPFEGVESSTMVRVARAGSSHKNRPAKPRGGPTVGGGPKGSDVEPHP